MIEQVDSPEQRRPWASSLLSSGEGATEASLQDEAKNFLRDQLTVEQAQRTKEFIDAALQSLE